MIQQITRFEEMSVETTISPEMGKIEHNQNKSKKNRGRGRPRGSKNKNKENVHLSPYLCFIQTMVKKVLELVANDIAPVYIAMDGAFGHNNAFQMAKQCGLHLISKLQYNSALYFPYEGPYSGRGRRRKYGEKLNYDHIPETYLKETVYEKSIQTNIYQMVMLHKLFSQKLNVVIIVKTNLKTHSKAYVILFSSDLDLDYEKLIEYYRLRFQIEFNFRDAKQYWGLEDFMNIKETPVTNATNLAFFMVNLSSALILDVRKYNPLFSIIDLKAYFRGSKYVNETLKLLPQKPDPILIQQMLSQIAKIGSVNGK